MPNPLVPEDPGLLASVARFLGTGGTVVRNALKGNAEGIGRNLVDFGGDVVDSFLPGDLIPHISRAEDRPEFRDVVDTGRGLSGNILNFLGDVATDPLTFVPGAAIAKVGAGIGKGVKAVTPKVVQEGAGKLAKGVRQTFGAQRVSKEGAAAIRAGNAAKDLTERAGGEAILDNLMGSTKREREVAGEVLHNLKRDKDGKVVGIIDPEEALTLDQRLDLHLKDIPDLDPKRMADLVRKSRELMDAEWQSGQSGEFAGKIFTPGPGIKNYAPRQFSDSTPDELLGPSVGGNPSAIKSRQLMTPEELRNHIQKNPNVSLEFDVAKMLTSRNSAQAELGKRGEIGSSLMERAKLNPELLDEGTLKDLSIRMLGEEKAAREARAAADLATDLATYGGDKTVLPNVDDLLSPMSKIPSAIPDVTKTQRSGARVKLPDMPGDPALIGKRQTKVIPSVGPVTLPVIKTMMDQIADINLTTARAGKSLPPEALPNIDLFGVPNVPSTVEEAIGRTPRGLPSLTHLLPKGDVGRIPKVIRGKPGPKDVGEELPIIGKTPKVIEPLIPPPPLDRIAPGLPAIPPAGNLDLVALAKMVAERESVPAGLPDIFPKPVSVLAGPEIPRGLPDIGYKPPAARLENIPTAPPVREDIPWHGERIQPKAPAPPPSSGRVPLPTITPVGPDLKARTIAWFGKQNYRHADPIMRSAAESIAKQLPEEEARVMLDAMGHMAPRGAFTTALSKLNRYFKPYAVYGAVLPKLGSITRNLTGGLWQQMSNAEARGSLKETAPQIFKSWLRSVDDGVEKLFGKRFTQNEFAQVDRAYKASGGDPRKVLGGITDPTMREAVQHGILGNNYVDTEQLISSFDKGGWRSMGKNLLDYPGAMFKGAEQRMRYGLYKSLRAKHTPEEAARITNETFYDYSISSVENRRARDVIPFFQFMAKSVPQQAKFMAEKPVVASALSNLVNQGGNEPVMPNMEGRINLPIGEDEQGNRQFVTGLGLPFESLGMIPNLSADPLDAGRQFEQNIVGSSQPLLKSLFAYTSGRDPYFGSTPGSYTKVAGQDLGQAGSVINQLISTGLPFASAGQSLLGQAGKLTDEKTTGLETAANLLTGIKIQSVDPDRALQLRLQELLERTPSVDRFTQLYDKSQDPETQELLKMLREAKANIKAKKAVVLPSN